MSIPAAWPQVLDFFGTPLVLEPDLRADPHSPGVDGLLVDEHRSLKAVAQDRDPALEQSLLVLGRVVLEVLREVAEAACRLDRVDDDGTARAFQLGQLGLELLLVRPRERLGLLSAHRKRVAAYCYRAFTGGNPAVR